VDKAMPFSNQHPSTEAIHRSALSIESTQAKNGEDEMEETKHEVEAGESEPFGAIFRGFFLCL